MRKMKRFSEGGFSKAQEDWLDGADRTDPFILARMRKAVPDEAKTETAPAKAEPAAEPAKATPVKMEPEFVTVSSDSPNLGTSKVEAAAKPRLPQTAKRRDESKAEIKTESKGEPKVDGKTFTETIAPAKVKPSDAKTENKPSKSAAEEDFDEKVRKLREADVSKIYPKKKSFFEDLKDRFGGKRVSGAKPSSDKDFAAQAIKRGGVIKKMASGGKVSSASSRGDGCAIRGKTRGKMY